MKAPLYVFDIDGTLADLSHRLHYIREKPKKWDAFFAACGDDAPIEPLVDLARRLHLSPSVRVQLWTGRPERTRAATEDWLIRQRFAARPLPPNRRVRANAVCDPYALPDIRMRAHGDFRADFEVKMEYLDPDDPPAIIFDDRTQVVRAFRDRGLRVVQVADGDY